MKYVLLIYEDEQLMAAKSESETASAMQGHYSVLGEMTMFGKHVYSEALGDSMTATVVRAQDGRTLTIDGPFAETKEMIAGFYIIEADNLDEAIAWAAKLAPHTEGAIEVRPIHDFAKGMRDEG